MNDPTTNAATDHTNAVREWLAAPIHERGYYWGQIQSAWREAKAQRVTGQCNTAATVLLRVNGKLKGIK